MVLDFELILVLAPLLSWAQRRRFKKIWKPQLASPTLRTSRSWAFAFCDHAPYVLYQDRDRSRLA